MRTNSMDIKKAVVVIMALFIMGCSRKSEDIIISRGRWDNEEAISIYYPDSGCAASFKLKDLKKLEMFLYDNELDYTDKYKNHKGWLHNFKGRRVGIKK